MKIIHTLLIAITLFIGGVSMTSGNWWPNPSAETYLCQGDDCSIDKGKDALEGSIDGLVSDKTFSEYVIAIIQSLTPYITLIGVIIIIYAGFTILFSGGDEEKVKKAKKLILYALLGIILIWLAWSIMDFVVREVLLSEGTEGGNEGG